MINFSKKEPFKIFGNENIRTSYELKEAIVLIFQNIEYRD
jgi:hypothetical protein